MHGSNPRADTTPDAADRLPNAIAELRADTCADVRSYACADAADAGTNRDSHPCADWY
jgi:hypothetical protein